MKNSEDVNVRREEMEKLLTTAEVAQLVGCSERHLRNLWDRGEFPRPIYLGRLVRHRRNDVREFLNGRGGHRGSV